MARPNETTNLEPWSPAPKQREVLERYAIGLRWYTASREVEVPDTTMAEWMRNEEFRALGEQMRTEVTLTALQMYGATVERAQKVMLRVKVADGDGDLDPKDPIVQWAFGILKSTLWPVLLARGLAGSGLQPNAALRAVGGGD